MNAYTRLERGTLDGIPGCVALGMGITVLPKVVVKRSSHADGLSTHALPPALSRATTVLVVRSDVRLSTALERFRDILQ